MESWAPVRTKAIGETTASRLETAYNVRTLAALVTMSDADIDRVSNTVVSATAKNIIRNGRAEARLVLGSEPDPRLPAAMDNDGLAMLIAMTPEALLQRARSAGLEAGAEEAVNQLGRYLTLLSNNLDASWLSTAGVTLGAVSRPWS